MSSPLLHPDGSVTCPICRVTRYNMGLMLSHLEFWHDLTRPNVEKVAVVIETGIPSDVVIRRDGTRQRLYVEVPLPGF